MPLRHPLFAVLLAAALVGGAAAPATAAAAAATSPPRSAVAASAGPTTHQVTILMLQPSGTEEDYTRDDALHSLAVVDAFYSHETSGRVRFSVAAASDWTAADSSLDCQDFDSVIEYARTQIAFSPGRDAHLLVMMPQGSDCAYAQGTMPDDIDAGGSVVVSTDDPTTIAHELGHNLSLRHTGSISCSGRWDLGSASSLPSTCSRVEYGNDSDIMGDGFTFYPFSPPSLLRLGSLGGQVVPRCGAAQRVTIATASAGSSSARVIGWRDPLHPSVSYHVQFRDAVDDRLYATMHPSRYAGADHEPTGIQVYRSDPVAPGAEAVLTRPGDASHSHDRVVVGERVALDDGMSVSVVAFDGAAHTATVDVTVPCTRQAGAPLQEGTAVIPSDSAPPVVVERRRV